MQVRYKVNVHAVRRKPTCQFPQAASKLCAGCRIGIFIGHTTP